MLLLPRLAAAEGAPKAEGRVDPADASTHAPENRPLKKRSKATIRKGKHTPNKPKHGVEGKKSQAKGPSARSKEAVVEFKCGEHCAGDTNSDASQPPQGEKKEKRESAAPEAKAEPENEGRRHEDARARPESEESEGDSEDRGSKESEEHNRGDDD